MKSVLQQTSDFRRTAATHGGPRRQRVTTDATVLALIAVIIALYVSIFMGVYNWIHYDPVFQPDSQNPGEVNLMPPQ